MDPTDFSVDTLGEATIDSPIRGMNFLAPNHHVCFFSDPEKIAALIERGIPPPSFTSAGARKKIFHDPSWTRAAIVTCGGLCPGLNDVIKALVTTLWYCYGVKNILGIRYGYRGLNPEYKLKPMELNPDIVDAIHSEGGSILGSSRGQQDTDTIVRTLERFNINMLFTIGGDGTQRATREIAEAAQQKGLGISVIGIPKTIDNDLNFMERTFGFETAVYAAEPVIECAHNEAKGAYNGIGLVRLMGRDAGFIAASATLANSVVNFCLIPEVPFRLEGDDGLLAALKRRLLLKHHAVVAVAEGAGQEFFDAEGHAVDGSGNKLHKDIGPFLKDHFSTYLTSENIDHTVKYFDPSYQIRSVAARGTDAIFCLHLAQNAVHCAMAGMTNIVIGYWHGHFTCVPIALAVRSRRTIDPHGQLWQSVLGATRQMHYFNPA
ncbi:MAG: ATP-dependent 6-phosphofructokinase [Lentisphaeria bacterium]|nr:ATP-dependent 6-phosphofructokinase [Lentisphaeria bacterium]